MLKKIKNNRLNTITVILSILFAVVYIIALLIMIFNGYRKSFILSVSANYFVVVSGVIIVIQLVAFVKDSRRKEFRSRKEAAYRIAREYADVMLHRVAFIETVLSSSYDKDPYVLEKCVCESKLTGFSNDEMKQNGDYKKYIELFLNKDSDNITYNNINNNAIIFMVPGFLDINRINEEKIKKHLANIRFKSFLFDTLNVLESFAMSVNQNVSDSEMLFSSLHQTFLKFVRFVYPFICYQNKECEVFYPNIIQLYHSWTKKKESDNKLMQELENNKKKKLNKGRTSSKPL